MDERTLSPAWDGAAPEITWLEPPVDYGPGVDIYVFYIRELDLFIIGREVSVSMTLIAMADRWTGRRVVPEEYDMVYPPFSEGLARVRGRGADGSRKYGYIDASGKMVLPLEYDSVSDLAAGMAFIGRRGPDGSMKYGRIDAAGRVDIPPMYDEREDVPGYAAWDDMQGVGWWRPGKDPIPSDEPSLTVIREQDEDGNRKCGFADASGRVVVPPEYDEAGSVDWDEDHTCGRFLFVVKDGRVGVFEDPFYEGDFNNVRARS